MQFAQGWRIFWCDECGEQWESASRDHASPSGEDCQRCGEWVFPYDSRPDGSLPVNQFGNLTQSYGRVNGAIDGRGRD